MKIGVQFPQFPSSTGLGDAAAMRDFVQSIDDLGFDSIWVGDHIILPQTIADKTSYPYLWRFSADIPDLFPNKNFLEAVATSGFIAGISPRLQIGVGVFVLPMRNPIIFAKEMATLDVLSGGRIIVGVGAGWMREEFEALGVPYEERGARFDEYLDIALKLWTGKAITHHGRFFSFDEIYCLPRPIRGSGPPLWFGGHTKRALERTARWGGGWHAIELSPADFAKESGRLDVQLEKVGRAPGEVARSVACRLPLSGQDMAPARQLVREYEEAGCDHLIVYATPTRTVSENVDRFRRLRETVLDGLVAG